MEPVSRRPGFAPPETPLTRRLLVYFASGAYTIARDLKSDLEDALEEAIENGEIGSSGEGMAGWVHDWVDEQLKD
jgi:hypothetical protein